MKCYGNIFSLSLSSCEFWCKFSFYTLLIDLKSFKVLLQTCHVFCQTSVKVYAEQDKQAATTLGWKIISWKHENLFKSSQRSSFHWIVNCARAISFHEWIMTETSINLLRNVGKFSLKTDGDIYTNYSLASDRINSHTHFLVSECWSHRIKTDVLPL